jgi:hypothetical protein
MVRPSESDARPNSMFCHHWLFVWLCRTPVDSGQHCCLADPTVPSCGNIYATVADGGAVEFDCTGARYDLALSPAAIVCASTGCSVRECCTTVRPTCADTVADATETAFDCSLAQHFLDHNPSQIFCATKGCSMLECCTASTPSDQVTPPPAGKTVSCATSLEFNAAFVPVTAECCDEPSEDCSSGYPTTCNAGCAAILLPVRAACASFLANGGVALAPVTNLIDAAAATCGATKGH